MKNRFAGLIFASCLVSGTVFGQNRAGDAADRKAAVVTALNLPAEFQPNRGQAPAEFNFIARGFGYSLGISPVRAQLALAGTERRSSVIGISFPGANRASQALPIDKMAHTSGYFVGQRAIVGIPSYAQLRYAGVWPGIDVVYYGNSHKLEYDLVVAPNMDPRQVRMRFDGVKKMELSKNGDLLLKAENNEVIQRAPVAYQTIASNRVRVSAHYVLEANQTVSLALGDYDRSKELVIDPVIVYATLVKPLVLGYPDTATAIVTDGAGTVTYVAGTTVSGSLGLAFHEVYIVKLDNSGPSPQVPAVLGFAGYAAGDGNLYAESMDLDAAGNVYVSGYTDSHNALPLANAIQTMSGGGLDAFLLKVPGTLSVPLYSSYLGGAGDERNTKVAVGQNSQIAYVVGQTTSPNWPTAGSPAGQNGFIYAIDTTKVPTSGNLTIGRVYALPLGGSGTDAAAGVAVDTNSNVYVGGSTTSTDFQPASSTGYQTSKINANLDGFVVKLNPGGAASWFTYYPGGPVSSLAQYLGQFAYVTGQTSGAINTTATAFQPSGGANHAFVAKFDTNANLTNALTYASYFGFSGQDAGLAISVPQGGLAYVGGWTTSPDFTPKGSPLVQTSFNPGVKNGFLAYFDPTMAGASSLTYSTLIGTAFNTIVTGLSAAPSGEVSVIATATDSGGNNAGGAVFKIGSRIWDKTFFVTQQYADLLDRSPDPVGLAYWVSTLNATPPLSREQLAASYFTSPEFSITGLTIIKYYIAAFNRDPDYAGWVFFFNAAIQGQSLDSILSGFLTSPEFTNTYGSLTNQAFVNLVYQNVLHRVPDANGGAYYLNLLNMNLLTRSQVMSQFINGAEFNSTVRARAFANLLYMGFLRRSADPAGLQFYTSVLANPSALSGAVRDFILSPEYIRRFF